MPPKYRPGLLQRLLTWRPPTPQPDPADMGTDIGLEYILAQAAQPATPPRGPSPSQPRQRQPS
jgi:hypothetical protein